MYFYSPGPVKNAKKGSGMGANGKEGENGEIRRLASMAEEGSGSEKRSPLHLPEPGGDVTSKREGVFTVQIQNSNFRSFDSTNPISRDSASIRIPMVLSLGNGPLLL